MYCLRAEFPESYPWVPPVLTFVTPIWHPNVCPMTGSVQTEVMYPQWLFSIPILQVLEDLQDLLAHPVVDGPCEDLDPQDVTIEKVQHQFMFSPELFARVAKRWNRKSLGLECAFYKDARTSRSQSVFGLNSLDDSLSLACLRPKCSRKLSSPSERFVPRSPLAA